MRSAPSDNRRVIRTYRKAVATLLLSVAAVGQANVSFALAPASKAEAVDDADGLVTRGIALRRSGEDARALELFQQAEQLDPESARVRVHLAATYQALGEWEAADRYLTRALENPADPYIEKHQATLASARHTIDEHIGSIEIVGEPRGTQIRLNGRLVGTLPIARAVRVKAGIYTLEAQLPGHYPVTRSVALAGGVLVRESVELSPLGSGVGQFQAEDKSAGTSSNRSWLTWTFAGLAVGAGVGTGIAWAKREQHADAWNDDDQCLSPTQTREQLCGNERKDGERAETWMWVGTAATGTFAAAAVVSYFLNKDDADASSTALSCGVGLGEVLCAGRF
jgi:tetratricopeptide (TPR) repeat protein